MEQVAKLKGAWNLDPVFWIAQKISEKYCHFLHLSIDQVWWVNELWFKNANVSRTNTHHGVTDLVKHRMVKNTKTWISRKRNMIFFSNKKILNLWLRWHILRNCCFVSEVTFKRVYYCLARSFSACWYFENNVWRTQFHTKYFIFHGLQNASVQDL